MLSNAAPKQMDLSATQRLSQRVEELAAKKIWLPRLLYDALPWFYFGAGLLALFATLYVSDWFWVLPHYLLFSAACLHLGIAVYRKRDSASARGEGA